MCAFVLGVRDSAWFALGRKCAVGSGNYGVKLVEQRFAGQQRARRQSDHDKQCVLGACRLRRACFARRSLVGLGYYLYYNLNPVWVTTVRTMYVTQ